MTQTLCAAHKVVWAALQVVCAAHKVVCAAHKVVWAAHKVVCAAHKVKSAFPSGKGAFGLRVNIYPAALARESSAANLSSINRTLGILSAPVKIATE